MRLLGTADQMMWALSMSSMSLTASSRTKPQEMGFAVDTHQAECGPPAKREQRLSVAHKAGYHTSLPMDITNDLRSRICLRMEDWGVKVKYHHHEVGGCGQLEVKWSWGK